MHEFPAVKGIIEISLDAAEKAGAEKIKSITIVLGELSSFIDESVKMYFEELSKGTAAEGADLIFRRMPAVLVCRKCRTEYGMNSAKSLDANPFSCPQCGAAGRFLDAGTEFRVESIEIEE